MVLGIFCIIWCVVVWYCKWWICFLICGLFLVFFCLFLIFCLVIFIFFLCLCVWYGILIKVMGIIFKVRKKNVYLIMFSVWNIFSGKIFWFRCSVLFWKKDSDINVILLIMKNLVMVFSSLIRLFILNMCLKFWIGFILF